MDMAHIGISTIPCYHLSFGQQWKIIYHLEADLSTPILLTHLTFGAQEAFHLPTSLNWAIFT
jgi:hypothetical protein